MLINTLELLKQHRNKTIYHAYQLNMFPSFVKEFTFKHIGTDCVSQDLDYDHTSTTDVMTGATFRDYCYFGRYVDSKGKRRNYSGYLGDCGFDTNYNNNRFFSTREEADNHIRSGN